MVRITTTPQVNVSQKESVLNTECRPVLASGGTGGASVNIIDYIGTKAQMQDALTWLFWAWYFPIRLSWLARMHLKAHCLLQSVKC